MPELLSGWSNGRLEVRNHADGGLVYKQSFSSAVSAILNADYRLDGRETVIACALDGEVRGFLPAEAGSAAAADRTSQKVQKCTGQGGGSRQDAAMLGVSHACVWGTQAG